MHELIHLQIAALISRIGIHDHFMTCTGHTDGFGSKTYSFKGIANSPKNILLKLKGKLKEFHS